MPLKGSSRDSQTFLAPPVVGKESKGFTSKQSRVYQKACIPFGIQSCTPHHCHFPPSQFTEVLISIGGIWSHSLFHGFFPMQCYFCYLVVFVLFCFNLQKGFFTYYERQKNILKYNQGQVVLLLSCSPKSTVLDIKEQCEHNYFNTTKK